MQLINYCVAKDEDPELAHGHHSTKKDIVALEGVQQSQTNL